MANYIWENMHKFIKYNPESGKLFWLPRDRKYFKDLISYNRHNNNLANTEIVSKTKSHNIFYVTVSIYGKNYLGHRIAWKIYYGENPPECIDHIDGDGLNNKISNLRDGTKGVNERNAKMNNNNKTGIKGVSWDKNKNKYKVTISNSGKNIHLGMYENLHECKIARKVAEKILNYGINHGVSY